MIYSVGHSSLALPEFEALLAGAAVTTLWDIRSYPTSRWPWFARAALEERLVSSGVQYRWTKALGGRQAAPHHGAPSRGEITPPDGGGAPTLFAAPPGGAASWQSEGFSNYMWYMAGEEFLAAAAELLQAGRRGDLAIMCAEALWWRCHRAMVADFVVYAGGEVVHLQPRRTLHSAVIGDRLARYAPEVVAAWDTYLAAPGSTS